MVDVTGSTLAFGKLKVKLPDAQRLVLRVVVDNLSTDIYAGEHGLFHLPCFGLLPSKTLSIEAKGGDAAFSKLQIHELKTIWKTTLTPAPVTEYPIDIRTADFEGKNDGNWKVADTALDTAQAQANVAPL